MTSPLVSRAQAHTKLTHHQFVPGLGYVAHDGPPELPDDARGNKSCDPPVETPDGSRHVLRPPGGHGRITLIWVAAERAWRHPLPGHGNRMAWTADHLSRAGWKYVGPEPVAVAKRGRRDKK